MSPAPESLPFPLRFVEPELAPSPGSPTFDITEKVARICGRARPTGTRDKILVLHTTGARDAHADELVIELVRRGAPVHYFHTAELLRACRVSMRLGERDTRRGILETPTGDLALEEVRSVWLRAPEFALSDPPGLEGDAAEFARREAESALLGLCAILEDAFWVNPPDAERAAEEKLAQLRLADSLGLPIPRTLVTNDPHAAREFFESCRREMIIKTFQRLAGYADGRERLILTNRVLAEHLEHVDGVRHVPCLFQEYVPKDVELRITVVGRRVFAAEIHSQRSPISRDDYRRYDLANTPYHAVALPTEVEAACLSMLDRYGLSFAAIDMIRRPDGAFVFLELNASAQFLWIQDLTGMPILQALAEMLMLGSRE